MPQITQRFLPTSMRLAVAAVDSCARVGRRYCVLLTGNAKWWEHTRVFAGAAVSSSGVVDGVPSVNRRTPTKSVHSAPGWCNPVVPRWWRAIGNIVVVAHRHSGMLDKP